MAWSVVQSNSATTGGAASLAVTFSSNVTAGNKIIVASATSAGGAISTSTVKDGAANSWTKAGAVTNGNNEISLWYLDVPAGDAGTAPTMTATFSATCGASVVIQEVSGLATGNTAGAALDGTLATLTGSSASTGSPSYSTTASNEYLVSVLGDSGGAATVTAAGGWTLDAHSQNTNGNCNCLIEYKNSTGGAETDGFGAENVTWEIVEVAFLLPAAAGGGGGPFVPWQYQPHAAPGEPFTPWTPWLASPAPAAAAAAFVPQQFPAHRVFQPPGRARLGRAAAVAAGILAVTTLSPQPSSVPPAKPGPSIGHPAPHRAVARQLFVPAQLPRLTAKLPPTAVSPRPPHRAITRQVLAKTTLSPQPASVPPPLWRQPNAPRPAHRAVWRIIAAPAPAVVAVTAVPPSRPGPVTNRPPAPHQATGKGILAVTTLSAQPSRVPPPLWRQPFAPRPAHRAVWRVITSAPPAVVAVTAVPPSRPGPVTNRPPAPHRAITRRITGTPAPLAPPSRPGPVTNRPPAPHRAIVRQVLAKTILAAQPARVNGPQWRQPFAPRPPHRAIWRVVTGAAPPPPPFTIGALTAGTAAQGSLGPGDKATGALTATTAALGAITGTDV